MAADATFFFDTNIDQVVSEIREGLAKVAALKQDGDGGPVNDAARVRAQAEYNAVIDRTIAKFGQLNQLAKQNPGDFGAKNLAAGYQKAVTDAEKDLGRLAGRSGLNLDAGLEIRKGAIAGLVRAANEQLQAARLVLPVNVTGTRPVSSAARDFKSGFEGGAAQAQTSGPLPPKIDRDKVPKAVSALTSTLSPQAAEQLVKKELADRKAVADANAKVNKEEKRVAAARLTSLARQVKDEAKAEKIHRERIGQENNERLLDGASGERFKPGVVETGAKQAADTRGELTRYYERASDGLFDEIKQRDKLFLAERRLTAILEKEAIDRETRDPGGKARARENLDRLSDPTRKGGFTKDTFAYSGTGVAKIFDTEEDGVKKRITELYRRIGDGLHQLTEGTQAYNDELNKLERSGRTGRGISGGFIHGLTSGGFGGEGAGGLEGFAQAAGTTAKYSALYGVMGLLQNALVQVGAEMVNFADSNTDLGIAIENATDEVVRATDVDQEYVNTLQRISITAGSNVGDVQDIAAAGIRTIGLEADYSADQLKDLGAVFAQQSERMAILAKTDIKDSAGNLRAIGTAFDIKLQDTSRINDAIVTGKNVGGGDEKQTAQAVASAGEAAKSAGFTLEAISAIASRIQAATDQSGQAVGNKLSKIFSIVGGSAGQSAIRKLNDGLAPENQIDMNATIYDQLLQLAKANDFLSDAQRKGLVNSLGGTTAAKEFITVLESLDEVVDNNGKGLLDAGIAAEEYQKRLLDLSVTVREFQGALIAIIINLSNSGALDVLVGGFKAVVEVLKTLASFTGVMNTFLNRFELLGAGAGRWAIRLGEVAAALVLISKITGANGLSNFLLSQERTFRPQAALAREALNPTQGASRGAGAALATAAPAVLGAAGTKQFAAQSAVVTTAVAKMKTELAIGAASAATTAAQATGGIANASAAKVAGSIITAAELAAFESARQAAAAAKLGAAAGASVAGGVGVGVDADRRNGKLDRLKNAALGGTLVEGSARASLDRNAKSLAASAGSGLASIARTLVNPVSLAIGGFLAVGALKGKADEVGEAMKGADRTLANLGSITGKDAPEQAENFRNLASSSATARQTLEESRKGILGKLFVGEKNDDQIEALSAQEAYATAQAKVLEDSTKNVGTAMGKLAVFGDPATRTTETLTSALATLSDAGVSATERMRLLNKILGQTAPGDKNSLEATLRPDLARKATTKLSNLGRDYEKDLFFKIDGNTSEGGGATSGTNPLRTYFTKNASNLQALLERSLPKIAGDKDGSYTDEQAKGAAQIVANGVVADYMKTYNALSPLSQQDPSNSPDALRRRVFDTLVPHIKNFNVSGLAEAGKKAPLADIYKLITDVTEPQYQEIIAGLAPGDDQGKLAALNAKVRDIETAIRSVQFGDDPARLLELKASVLYEIGEVEVAENEKIRAALQGKAKGAKAIAAIGGIYFQKEFDDAYASGNLALILEVLNRGSSKQVAAVKRTVQDNITILKAQVANQKKVAYAVTLAQFDGGVTDAKDRADFLNTVEANEDIGTKTSSAELTKQKKILRQFDFAVPDNSINTGTSTSPKEDNTARDRAEKEIARRNRYALGAARLDAANRAVRDARTRLAAIAEKSGRTSKEYYDGLAALNNAKYELAQRELEAQNNANLLKIDLTDPVAAARAELADSKARRERAIKDANGAGLKGKKRADFLDPFELDVRNKQASVENTAVSEYLSNAETSLRLGRISHSTYMALLRAKRDQLQVEYDSMAKDAQGQNQRKKLIDSITQTLKGAASELDGQFNLGDIKVPTVYQVRRSIKAKTAGDVLGANGSNSTAGNVVNDSSTSNVVLNGVPIEKVVTILENLFGVKARTTTGKRRK